MADSSLYLALSGIYNGLSALNAVKASKTDVQSTFDTISGYLSTGAYNTAAGTIDARLQAISGALQTQGTSFADTANGKSGLLSGTQTDISIANGVVTVNAADKVKNKLSAFGVDFDGSASGELKVTGDYLTQDNGVIGLTVNGDVAENNTGLISGGAVYAETSAISADLTALHAADTFLSSVLKGYETEGAVSSAIKNITEGAATYQLSALTTANDGFAKSYQLVEIKNGVKTAVAESIINIPKDQFLKAAAFGYSTANDTSGNGWATTKTDSVKYPTLKLTFELSGTSDDDSIVYVPMHDLVDDYKAGSGITLDDNTNTFSVAVTGESFLYQTEGGVGLSGVQAAITTATSIASGMVAIGNASGNGIESSGYAIGDDTTDAVLSGSAKTLATEKEVQAAALKMIGGGSLETWCGDATTAGSLAYIKAQIDSLTIA